MNQNYTKSKKNYNDNLFFDNDIYENEAELPQFNLEKLARAELHSGLSRRLLKWRFPSFWNAGNIRKPMQKIFAGIADGHHKQRTIATRVREFGSESSSVKFGQEIPAPFGRLGLFVSEAVCRRFGDTGF